MIIGAEPFSSLFTWIQEVKSEIFHFGQHHCSLSKTFFKKPKLRSKLGLVLQIQDESGGSCQKKLEKNDDSSQLMPKQCARTFLSARAKRRFSAKISSESTLIPGRKWLPGDGLGPGAQFLLTQGFQEVHVLDFVANFRHRRHFAH